MARKSYKAKEPVRIRFKELADGNKSIYLDIYQDGKRTYDFLKLYLVPERTPADRAQNEQTMRAANAIKSQRIIDVANDAAGILSAKGKKIGLLEWVRNYPRTQAQQSKAVRQSDQSLLRVLSQFTSEKTRLADVDREFCVQFIKFLTEYTSPRFKRQISPISARTYYRRFVCALNVAVRNGLIASNPCNQLSNSDAIKAPEAQRCYLTQDELQRFIDTPAAGDKAITKQAFLFSCFCGLRISDVQALEWRDIATANGQTRLEIRMQKTQELLYIPLSQQALAYLPEQGAAADDDKVFCDLTCNRMTLCNHLRSITEAAGINKHVTFHTARHTFATLLLTKGADLYTTSKLLGHANIATTQIYAKIVDEKKQEAVSLLDNIFTN